MQNLHANRPAAVAGSFYSDNKSELSSQIKEHLQNAKSFEKQNINAIVVPHAGYVYSAPTASVAYKTLHKKYKNVFLLGSSHHVDLNGASIYNIGNYETPLGEVKVNQEIVSKLMENKTLFSYHKDAHTKEHTLEVQLPFLQTIYGEDLQIVPIIVATHNKEIIDQIAKELEPYFTDENLFIISTDLSHFPNYDDANNADKKTLESIATNNMNSFITNIVENENKEMRNFHTSACGWSSLLTLMNLTENKNYKYEILDYTNSGDAIYGDKSRVVGYGAMRIYKEESKESDEYFSSQEKSQIVEVAKLALHDAVMLDTKVRINKEKVLPKLEEKLGAFVTLYKDGNLRGCIGRFEPNQPLYEVLVDMAISSAFHDTRFKQVTKEELDSLSVEVSVLTPRKKINSIDEIEIGKHGIYVVYGHKAGTYLPHVATEMNWDAKEFVRHCAVEKAGIDPKNLQDIEIFVYEAIVFGDNKK